MFGRNKRRIDALESRLDLQGKHNEATRESVRSLVEGVLNHAYINEWEARLRQETRWAHWGLHPERWYLQLWSGEDLAYEIPLDLVRGSHPMLLSAKVAEAKDRLEGAMTLTELRKEEA